MVLAGDHTGQAAKEALSLIGVDPIEAVGHAVIDALRLERAVKNVPVASFVGNNLLLGKAHTWWRCKPVSREVEICGGASGLRPEI